MDKIMIHDMTLVPAAFDSVKSDAKTVEMRLFDEKRAKIAIGDKIHFENTETHETLLCEVIHLARFRDFFELYANYEKTAIGYGADETADPSDMYAFYSPERIEQFGALAIEIRTIDP